MGIPVLVWLLVRIDNDRQVLPTFVIGLPVFSGFIGDAGEIIDNAVIQPVVDDPVNTAIKLGAYYVGGPLGSAVASAGISAAQGNDIEDIARDAAVSYVAGQVGGQVGGAVAGETGSLTLRIVDQNGDFNPQNVLLTTSDIVLLRYIIIYYIIDPFGVLLYIILISIIHMTSNICKCLGNYISYPYDVYSYQCQSN